MFHKTKGKQLRIDTFLRVVKVADGSTPPAKRQRLAAGKEDHVVPSLPSQVDLNRRFYDESEYEVGDVDEAVAEESMCWARLVPTSTLGKTRSLSRDEQSFGRAELLWPLNIRDFYSRTHFTVYRELPESRVGSGSPGLVCRSPNPMFVGGKFLGSDASAPLKDGDRIAVVAETNIVFTYYESPNIIYPTALLRNYEVDKEIGSGSFGSVRLALRRCTAASVVVKIVHQSTKSDYQKKLLAREIQTVQSLRAAPHANIVRLLDLYEWRASAYLCMELADGGDLCARLVGLEDERLGEPTAKLYAVQLLRAVAHLHRLNIAHRDLKNENILLMSRAEECVVKICDFGLSKEIEYGSRGSGLCSIVGTSEYMPPEIVRTSSHYSAACDIWSAGVCIFRCLSGSFPFFEPNLDAKILDHDIFRRTSVWDKLVSKDAETLVLGMLEAASEDRPSARTLLQDAWFKVRPLDRDSLSHSGVEDEELASSLRRLSLPRKDQGDHAEDDHRVPTRVGLGML